MAKNKNQDDEKTQDKLKRNAEMAEKLGPNVAKQILKKGDKYYCAECNSELPMHTDCPTCHAHIDWERARFQGRPY